MSSALDFLKNKDQWTILADLLATTNNVIDKREGSVFYDAVAAVAVVLGSFLNVDVPVVYGAINALTATGNDLDAWAMSYGLERKGAEYTLYNITIEPNGKDLSVGEVLRSHSTNEKWIYQGNRVVISEDRGAYIETIGNTLEPENAYTDITSITIRSERTPGRNEETDDELRTRLIRSLSVKVGGSVLDYVDLTLSPYEVDGVEMPGFYSCLVFPCGRRCGYVDILPAHKSFADDKYGKPARWATPEECEALKKYIDPIDDEGWGYGKAPIGHRVRVNPAQYYDVAFYIYVVYNSNASPEQESVPDDVKEEVRQATYNYFNKIIDKGLFTLTNTPERHGNRYHMVYISAEHVAELESVKANHPEILTFQINYKLPGDKTWRIQSDDIVNLKIRRKNAKMFRVSSIQFEKSVRQSDKDQLDW